MNKDIALGIIDAQRGFMPAGEGERLGQQGFGELTVPDGEKIIAPLNKLLLSGSFDLVFTTQDWHPKETAHFNENPNYMTTWPTHCVAHTDGAKLHQDIKLPEMTHKFKKGQEILHDGKDDTSYSGFNAFRINEYYLGMGELSSQKKETLPQFLNKNNVKTLVLGGLALDYCVKATAIDFKRKSAIDVVVVTDATKPVAQETGEQALVDLQAAGVRLMNTDELIVELGGPQ